MIMFAFGKRLLRWQVVALLWAAPFVCLPTALAEETQGPDTDAGKIGLEAEGTVPALWQSPEGKAIVVAAKMITRGAAEPDFHAACLEDTAECVTAITSSAPEGYTFEYRETDEDVAEVIYTRGDGSSKTIGSGSAGAGSDAETGFEPRGCPYDKILEKCWLPESKGGFRSSCLTRPECYCSDKENQWIYPCMNSMCKEVGGPCDPEN